MIDLVLVGQTLAPLLFDLDDKIDSTIAAIPRAR